MFKNTKLLSILMLSALMIIFVGCSNNSTTDDQAKSNDQTTPDTATPTSKEDYVKYLNQRYDYYFDNSKLNEEYDIYSDDFKYTGTPEEFVGTYTGEYNTLKSNLESFKSDLNNNVVKGTDEVDKLNDEVVKSIDDTILSIDNFSSDFATKSKDYITLTSDEMVAGFRDLGRVPHEAREKLDDLIDDAKERLGIDY